MILKIDSALQLSISEHKLKLIY